MPERKCKHGCDVLDSRVLVGSIDNYFIKAIEHFFHVYIASSKHSGAGRILESYTNPRLRLGFAQLSRILPTLLVFR